MPGILEAIQKDDEELREGSLQALEALALRLPTEVTPYLGEIVQIGLQFIKYDPVSYFCSQQALSFTDLSQNYAGGDDEDEEMADADDDEDDDDDLDECAETFSGSPVHSEVDLDTLMTKILRTKSVALLQSYLPELLEPVRSF